MSRLISIRTALVAATCSLAISFATTTGLAADRPTHYSLPDETLFVVRAPAPAAFWEAVKTRTKLGSILVSEQRVADLEKLVREEAKDDLDEFNKGLDRLGLTGDDLLKALEGELGYAGLLLPTTAPAVPSYAGLAWSHSDDDLLDKWFAALERKLQDQPEGKRAVRREDLDLAGTKVVHLTIPIVELPPGATVLGVELTPPDGLKADLGLDTGKKVEPEKKDADKDLVETAQVHLLLARSRDRLTLAHTYAEIAAGEGEDAKAKTAAAAAIVEELKGTMVRFLAASRESDEGIVRRWEQTAGLAEALPDGETLLEGFVNLPRLVGLLNVPGNEDGWKFAQAAGVEKLGPIGYRAALDGTVFRSGLFVSIPAPRTGLLTLLDQAPLKPAPADWVAKNAVGYQHISFDLGKAYQLVAQTMRESLPRGEGALNALETQAQGFLQTDPATLLGSLGKTHTILTYLPTLADDADPRRANQEDAAAETAVAFVWTPSSDAIWRRLMTLLATATAQSVVTEQGFNGLRYEDESMSGSWFIGNGYMVVALGKGVTEKVLANLRSTPRTDESLRGTDYAKRAAELLPAAGTLTYDLTDGAGLLRFTNQIMQRAFADITDTAAAKLKLIWPTEQELEGTIGVSASAVTVDGNGLTYRSVLDLPSP